MALCSMHGSWLCDGFTQFTVLLGIDSCVKRRNERLVLQVRDSGLGLASQEIQTNGGVGLANTQDGPELNSTRTYHENLSALLAR